MKTNTHTFIISIDDGDCRYEYPLTLKNGIDVSIHDIYKALCKEYKVETVEGVYCASRKAKEIKKILNNK